MRGILFVRTSSKAITSLVCGEFCLFVFVRTSSKAITSLVKRCCDVLVCSFERDDLEQVNVLNVGTTTEIRCTMRMTSY